MFTCFSKSSASNIHLTRFSQSPIFESFKNVRWSNRSRRTTCDCYACRGDEHESHEITRRDRGLSEPWELPFLDSEIRNSHESRARFFERFLRTATRTRRLCQRRCDEEAN